jgi:hypothetical protein
MVLHLVLKTEWYEMIDSGVKTEEYRNITNHWMSRILSPRKGIDAKKFPWASGIYNGKHKIVEFQLGYAKKAKRMRFKIASVCVGTGIPDWGAEPGVKYFIIKLGDRI